ncbi:hypothetical protein [Phaeodactylibacter xiamenensis]|jgi:hypothetical protein|uniref:hypothetical protein n=1 Tax=Phaeodactylibacter xiamenensis TaxID=1524460 RepID=UPI003BAAC2B9
MTGFFKLPATEQRSRATCSAALVLLASLFTGLLYGQSPCDCETFSRLIKKEYQVYPTVLVNISNKYGPVSVEGWAHNRIRVEALTEVEAEHEAAAAQVFDRIETEVNIQQRLVNIQTNIAPAEQAWWPFPSLQTADYSVSIRVFLPQPAAISLLNKHGAVTVKNITGNVSAEVLSGDVFGANLEGEVTLNQKDGTLNLEQITRLNADLVNVEGSLTSGDWVKIRSRSAILKFRNIGRLESETRYDNYYVDGGGIFTNQGRYDEISLDRVREVEVSTSLSRLYVNRLRHTATIEADSSRVRITDLPDQFRTVKLEGRFTDFRLVLDPLINCQLRATARHAGIRYPYTLHLIEEIETSDRHTVSGYFGQQRQSNIGRVEASLDYGGLTIEAD